MDAKETEKELAVLAEMDIREGTMDRVANTIILRGIMGELYRMRKLKEAEFMGSYEYNEDGIKLLYGTDDD